MIDYINHYFVSNKFNSIQFNSIQFNVTYSQSKYFHLDTLNAEKSRK